MEEKPLVGDDGAFFTAKLGQEYEGDGTKTLNVLVAVDDPPKIAGRYTCTLL